MIGMNPAYGDEFVEYHWRIELLDYESWLLVETFTKADDTNPIGVVAGELNWSIFKPISESGSISIVAPAEAASRFDWNRLLVRVAIDMVSPEQIEHTLGVYVPTVSSQTFDGGYVTLDVELQGRTVLLSQQKPTSTVGIPAGSVITDVIQTRTAHLPNVLVTPSDKTLSADRVYILGAEETSELSILSDLAEAVPLFAAYTDPTGWIRFDLYLSPGDRPLVHTFVDDEHSMHAAEWMLELKTFDTPNRLTVFQRVDPVAVGDADEGEVEAVEPLVAVAVDVDPLSEFSFQRRGNRWIDADPVEADGETLAELLEIAEARLVEAQTSTQTLEITCLFMPFREHEAVRFVNRAAGLDEVFTVSGRSIQVGSSVMDVSLRRTLRRRLIDE